MICAELHHCMKKTVSIKKNYEFQKIYSKGNFYVGRFVTLYIRKNNLGINRLGVVASKKVGKSVKRNRIRRIIKEVFRKYQTLLHESYDYVFVARQNESDYIFSDIAKEIRFLFKKLNVIKCN